MPSETDAGHDFSGHDEDFSGSLRSEPTRDRSLTRMTTVDVAAEALQEAYEAGRSAALEEAHRLMADPFVRRNKTARPKKQDVVADLLRRPQGCLTWEILEATGWPAVNVHRFARVAGLAVRKERVRGNTFRFFGEPVGQAARA